MGLLRVSQLTVDVADAGDSQVRVSQLLVDVMESLRTGPTSGGAVDDTVVNPAVANLATGVKRVFVRFTLGTGSPYTELAYAETTLSDPSSYFGGQKPALLLSVSPITRELSDSVRGTEVTVVLADDGTRPFRTLAATEILSGQVLEIFVVEDDVRYALGEPYRLICGLITDHRAVPGFRYEFKLRDVLSERLATLDDAPLMPPVLLNAPEFPGIAPAYENRAIQLVLGKLDDTTELPAGTSASTVPQGVVAPLIVGLVNFTAFGGIDQDAIACILTHGAAAANGVWQVYFNPPDNPYQRFQIPLSFFGVGAWAPGMPGWDDVVGAGGPDYIDYPPSPDPESRRYTPFFVAADHPYAQAFLDGKVLVALNMFGVAENADGTGAYLSDPARIWQWLLVNFLYGEYRTGSYAAIPKFAGGPSIINVQSVDDATTTLRGFNSGTYEVGFVLGADGKQDTLRHVLDMLCAGVLMEQGIDRHGRLMVSVEDPAATAVVTYSALHDIEDGFTTWIDRAGYRNQVEYYFGFRYVPPTAPVAAPAEGEALPARPVDPYSSWTSGQNKLTHSGALAANNGVIKKLTIENRVVRSAAVAADVATRTLNRLAGASPNYEGARMFSFTTSWQGLMKNGIEVDLGTVIAVDHLEGIGASGWTAQRCRVLKITVDPLAARVTLEGRVLS